MPVEKIENLAKFKEINSDKPVLIDFWATWCGPCRMISPIFEKLSEDAGGVSFYKVDVDEQPDISQEVGIKAMPTFMLFKDGQKTNEVVGAVPQKLETMVIQAKSLC